MLSTAERHLQRLVPHCAHANAILKKTVDKGTGWYSIGNIKPKEIILSVPAASWLPYSSNFASMEAARNSEQFIQVVQNLIKNFKEVNMKASNDEDLKKLESSIHLAVKLMLDCDDNDVYLSALVSQTKDPSYVPLPITVATKDSSVLSPLNGTIAHKAVKERQLMYSYFADQLFGVGSPSADRFVWSMSQILSRALSFPASRSTGVGGMDSEIVPFTLVPMLDFVNHSSSPNAKYEYCGQQHQFTLYPLREINEDEEITISYGEERSNASFFALYGFVDKSNTILGTFQYSLQALFVRSDARDNVDRQGLSNHRLITTLNNWKLNRCSMVVEGKQEASADADIEVSDAVISISFTADLAIFQYLDQLGRAATLPVSGSEHAGFELTKPEEATAFVTSFRAAFEDVLHNSRVCVLRCEDVLACIDSGASADVDAVEPDFRRVLTLIQEKKYIHQSTAVSIDRVNATAVGAAGGLVSGSGGVHKGIINMRNEVSAVGLLIKYIDREKLRSLVAAVDGVCVDNGQYSPGSIQLRSYAQDIATAEREYWEKMLQHLKKYLVLLLAAAETDSSS